MSASAALRAVPERRPGNPFIDEWEMYGQAAGWTERTLHTRRQALEIWQRRTGLPIEQMTSRDLAVWLASCSTPGTKLTYYKHVRSFFTWLQASGFREDDPTAAIPRPRVPRRAPRPVPSVALSMALASASVKTYTYMILCAYAGMRVSEVARVRGEDLDLEAGTLRVLGKGGYVAVIPLHPRVAVVSRGYPRRGLWFPARSTVGGHVRPTSVSQSITATFRRAGYPGVTAHQLRHWFGTNVLRSAGGNLRVAQELLRHASPATTALYTLIEDADRRRAIDGLPG